jgi:hypothetical protein
LGVAVDLVTLGVVLQGGDFTGVTFGAAPAPPASRPADFRTR